MFSHQYLIEAFDYNLDTGLFTHRVRQGSGKPPGEIAGYIGKDGYRRISVRRKIWYAHRLAWFYVFGEWPSRPVDHVNGDRSDNRFLNLRAVSAQQNMENRRGPQRNNRSGLLGVYWAKSNKAWCASIQTRGRVIKLGYFGDKNEAHEVYLQAKRRLHAGCTI